MRTLFCGFMNDFPVAMMKRHDQDNSEKEEFIWIRGHNVVDSVTSGLWSSELRAYVFNCKHTTRRINQKCFESLNSQSPAQGACFFHQGIASKPPKQRHQQGPSAQIHDPRGYAYLRYPSGKHCYVTGYFNIYFGMHVHCKIIKVLCFIRIIAYGAGEITWQLRELPALPGTGVQVSAPMCRKKLSPSITAAAGETPLFVGPCTPPHIYT